MPYIKKVRRQELSLDGFSPITSGELNYVVTKTILDYLKLQGATYNTLNDIVGVLENAKQEFVRRVVVPYEDCKIFQNGDLYPPQIWKV